MRGVKRCFVCRQDHLVEKDNSKDEITAATEHFTSEQPTAPVNVSDLSAT